MSESVCQQAHRITTQDRRDEYGHPAQDFSRIAEMWTQLLNHPVTPLQVASCMIALTKLPSMLSAAPPRDVHSAALAMEAVAEMLARLSNVLKTEDDLEVANVAAMQAFQWRRLAQARRDTVSLLCPERKDHA